MKVKIEESWRLRLQEEFDKPYFERLTAFVRNEYAHAHVLPPGSRIFYIFNVCPFDKVKVIILWRLFLRPGRNTHPRLFGQHLSGNPSGFRKTRPGFRQFRPLGRTGRVLLELRTDGKGIRNRIPPQRRLGNVHRCRHP